MGANASTPLTAEDGPATPWLLVLAVFGAGLGSGGSQIGINVLSASYPTASRAPGVSWANAVSRTASLVGPVTANVCKMAIRPKGQICQHLVR